MARVKTGTIRRSKHKKIFASNKGYRMTRKNLIRTAKSAYLHAGEYAFMGRKLKKRNFRRLWIIRLNAALKNNSTSYNKFINTLTIQNILLDRKILSSLAADYPLIFKGLIKSIFKS